MKNQMISVLMCVYNETPVDLKQAINSILNQTFGEFEFLIILDNPQNIELLSILRKYKNYDKRIRLYINEKNIGLPNSLNRGLKLSHGNYIARMDADDISVANRLQIQKDYLDKHSNISLVSGNFVYINEKNEIIKRGISFKNIENDAGKIMKYGNIIAHPCTMFRKKDVIAIGGYRPISSAEDYDLWIRLIMAGKKVYLINKCLLRYRVRNNSISNKNLLRQDVSVRVLRKSYRKNQIANQNRIDSIIEFYSLDEFQTYINDYRVFEDALSKLKKGDFISFGNVMLKIIGNREICRKIVDMVVFCFMVKTIKLKNIFLEMLHLNSKRSYG